MSTYTLYVGSTPGAYDIAAFQTSNLSLTVNNIPTDGRTLYVTLYGNAGGVRTQQDTATYTAANIVKAVITGPGKGSHLNRHHVTFTWTPETGGNPPVSLYRLYVGSTPGAYDLAAVQVPGTSVLIGNLPTDSTSGVRHPLRQRGGKLHRAGHRDLHRARSKQITAIATPAGLEMPAGSNYRLFATATAVFVSLRVTQ